MLLDGAHFEDACVFLSKVFTCYEILNQSEDLFECQKLIWDDLSVSIKLVTKLSIKMNSPLPVERLGQQELTAICVLIAAISLISKSTYAHKQNLISKMIIQLKNELKDNGLFLFFLSSITFYINFNINLKPVEDLQLEGACRNYQGLILAHINALQCLSQREIPQELLMTIYSNLKIMVDNAPVGLVSEYELNVISMITEIFIHNRLYQLIINFLSIYISTRRSFLSDAQLQSLLVTLADCQLSQGQPLKACDTLKELDTMKNIPKFEKIYAKLDGTHALILSQDMDGAKTLLESVFQLLKTKEYQINGQSNKLEVAELLLLTSRFCVLSGLLHYEFASFVNSILAYKKSIRTLQSVIKNFLTPSFTQFDVCTKYCLKLKMSSFMLTTFESLLECMSSAGLKEFDYYEAECNAFIDTQPSAAVKCYYGFLLSQYQSLKNNIEKSTSYLSGGLRIYNQLKSSGVLIDLENIAANLLFFQVTDDSKSVKMYAEKLETLLLELSAMKTIDYDSVETMVLQQYYNRVQGRASISALHGSGPISHNIEYTKSSQLIKLKSNLNESLDSFSQVSVLSGILEAPLSYPHSSASVFLSSNQDSLNNVVENLHSCKQQSFKFLGKFQSYKYYEKRDISDTSNHITSLTSQLSSDMLLNTQTPKIFEENVRHSSFIYEKQLATAVEDGRNLLVDIDLRNVSSDCFASSEMITSVLPDNWIAVSIAYSQVSKSLLFTRYSHSLEPFTLQLPLTKSMSRVLGQNNFDFNDASEELVSIIQESKIQDWRSYFLILSQNGLEDSKAFWVTLILPEKKLNQ
ncbi:unnamed protein product [Ambrosiozyma monospora]|uniref:Unnamed protein product n=1 Tax=Ambrosiozyma monospora TaxID=43982 RepID=A0ACB5T7A2_AMBMO|nr:unnamed protein product [Ambrosiozyma monospora]